MQNKQVRNLWGFALGAYKIKQDLPQMGKY